MTLSDVIQRVAQSLIVTAALATPVYGFHTVPQIQPPSAKAHEETVCHLSLSRRALDQYISTNPASKIARDLKEKSARESAIQGSVNEDTPVINCNEHFFNPDRAEDKNGLFFLLLNDGSRDALERAEKIWARAKQDYTEGKIADAYDRVFRVAHLVAQDSSSPEHTYLIDHAFRIVEVVTKEGSKIALKDIELLKKIGQNLNPDVIDWNSSKVVEEGSPWEVRLSQTDLSTMLGAYTSVATKFRSLKELITSAANHVLHPKDAGIAAVMDRNFSIGPEGNGKRLINIPSDDDFKVLAPYVARSAIDHTIAVLDLWERTINKSDPEWLTFLEQSKDPKFAKVAPMARRLYEVTGLDDLFFKEDDFVNGEQVRLNNLKPEPVIYLLFGLAKLNESEKDVVRLIGNNVVIKGWKYDNVEHPQLDDWIFGKGNVPHYLKRDFKILRTEEVKLGERETRSSFSDIALDVEVQANTNKTYVLKVRLERKVLQYIGFTEKTEYHHFITGIAEKEITGR